MKDNKFFGVAFIAVLVLLLVFVSTQIPGAHSTPNKLPVGLVVADQGPMGQIFVEMIQKTTEETGNKTFEWVLLNSEEEMNEQFENQGLYGALLIPNDFSQKYATFQTAEPSAAELKIYINKGKNANVATVVTQALTTMVSNMNANVSTQLFEKIEQANIPLTVLQAKVFATPISSEMVIVHETGKLSNATLSFFQPIWIASIVSAILLWFAGRNRQFTSVAEQLKFRGLQALTAIVLGLFTGYLLTWYTTWMLDFEFASFNSVALFLAIVCAAFILLILAVTSWIGFAGVPIFVLLMFFGLPLLQLVPEMMPSFYADWIYPWLPFRFMADGLREILFFSGETWNTGAITLCWFAVVSIIILLLKGGSKLNIDTESEGMTSESK